MEFYHMVMHGNSHYECITLEPYAVPLTQYSGVRNSRTYRNRRLHWAKFAEKLIVEYLLYTISIAANKRTPGIFSHCINDQICLTIRDTGEDPVKLCWYQALPQRVPKLNLSMSLNMYIKEYVAGQCNKLRSSKMALTLHVLLYS